LVREVTDWDYLFRLASRHAVTPLVCHVLGRIDASNLPAVVLAQLRAASRTQATRSLHQTGALAMLLDLFDVHSIPVAPFKGPALACSLYGDGGFRYSVDLDILIRRKDVLPARDILLHYGYGTDFPDDPLQQEAYLGVRDELHFTSHDGTYVIELHHALLAPFYSLGIDYDVLWERMERQTFCGREILALRSGDLLLALCAHATKHSWSSLGWICDIGRLLQIAGGELNWRDLTTWAASFGARRMLLLGVFLANDLLGAPVPAHVLEQAGHDKSVDRLARAVRRSLFDQRSAGGELRSHLFFLQARERLRDRLAYCTHLALQPTEEDRALLSMPAVLSPLYYPLHAGRVAGKYGRIFLTGAAR
jgi:hypothetical protein